jgi:hypothetical protein
MPHEGLTMQWVALTAVSTAAFEAVCTASLRHYVRDAPLTAVWPQSVSQQQPAVAVGSREKVMTRDQTTSGAPWPACSRLLPAHRPFGHKGVNPVQRPYHGAVTVEGKLTVGAGMQSFAFGLCGPGVGATDD